MCWSTGFVRGRKSDWTGRWGPVGKASHDGRLDVILCDEHFDGPPSWSRPALLSYPSPSGKRINVQPHFIKEKRVVWE